MRKVIKIIIAIVAAGAILASAYFLFSVSNTVLLSGGNFSKLKLPNEQSETSGELQTEAANKITLVAVGDMMLSRNVEQKMIAQKDWKYPFLKTADITEKADIAFGNLETPIVKGNIVQSGSFLFRTDPKAVEGLQFAGFDVLSLANNHMTNFARAGLLSTLQNLDAAGISHAGAGLSTAEINQPSIVEVKGVKFGLLAYSYSNEQVSDGKGGTYGVARLDTLLMQKQVALLKQSVDVVLVSMHAGTEYATEPNATQKNFARAAVDAGATLMIGHHPHVVETFEKYNDGYIIYSLGNFVFDQMWSEETRLGAIARITFADKKVSKIDFVPVKIYDYAQPQVATGADAEMILKRLKMKESGK